MVAIGLELVPSEPGRRRMQISLDISSGGCVGWTRSVFRVLDAPVTGKDDGLHGHDESSDGRRGIHSGGGR